MESLKNLKPTGLGLRIERIKPPFVVENPAKQVIKLSSLNNELGRNNTQKKVHISDWRIKNCKKFEVQEVLWKWSKVAELVKT